MSFEFEPFAPESRTDPYPAYRRLRDEQPVHYAPEADVWCISRYDDVQAVLKNPEVFSSEAMFTMLMGGGREGGLPLLSWKVLRFVLVYFLRTGLNPFGFARARNLIAADPPAHGELRNVVNRGFTPRRIQDWEPRIREIVAERMEALRAAESFDLVSDFNIPLPVTIIAEMLGVEPELRTKFKHWSDTIIEGATGAGRGDLFNPAIIDTITEFNAYLKDAVDRRRREPTDDLISAILAKAPGGTTLSTIEAVMFVQLLLVAGNETTTNLLGNAVHALLDHPDQLERVVADPSRVPGLVEEVLRWDAPVQLLFRKTTREVELAGTRIPAGVVVAPLLGSANRDERRFPDGERFDVARETQGHLAFGFANHFCLGASLARLEARIALEALVPELPGMSRPEAGRDMLDSFLVRGPTRLTLQRAA